TLEEALKALINYRITGLPVVDRERRMVGVVSEYDLIRQISKFPDLTPEIFQQPIEFTRQIMTVPTSTPLSQLVTHFIDQKFRRLPVVDQDQRLVGIITRRDLMRVFYYRAK